MSGRHGDDDGDGIANHVDPDWNASADVLLGDTGADPDLWVGVTRERLPITGPDRGRSD